MNEYKEKLEHVKDFLEKRKNLRTACSAACNLKQIENDITELKSNLSQGKQIKCEHLYSVIDCMIGENTLTFDSELPENIKIRRGQPVEIKDVISVERLSYNKNHKQVTQGRFNPEGQSLFYGTIHFRADAGINIIFSELKVQKGSSVCILNSKTIEPLTYRQIGLFEQVRIGNKKPWYMAKNIWEYYKEIFELYKRYSHKADFKSFLLVEEFMHDVLSKRNHKNVYDIGNAVANILLDGTKVEGLIYNSVYDNQTPNIVLKQCAADNKLLKIDAEAFKVNNIFLNSRYNASKTHRGEVLTDSKIIWSEEGFHSQP